MTGLVHIYCGDGKGKTSAAFGLALRCLGHGEQVVIAQFLKDGQSGECQAISRLSNVYLFAANPTNKFSFQMNDHEKTQTANAAAQCFQNAVRVAREKPVRLLVLDEVMAAISCGFLTCAEVAAFLETRPENLEVVMTGRNPPPPLLALANYVSEINKQKHPYDQGVSAREGIEW